MVNPNIFRAYDIRGFYPEEIDEEFAYKLGQAFGQFLVNLGEAGQRKIVVGRDARLSSDDLAENLINGLVSQSFDVIDLGLISTPFFYWAINNEDSAGGLMVTASHNPARFNGFKVCRAGAQPVGGETGLMQLRDLVQKNLNFEASFSPGKTIQKNLLPAYIDFIEKRINPAKIKPFKIIIDCANGVMGREIKLLIKNLPGRWEILFDEPDGNFPNHEPNPSKEENLTALKNKVREMGADLGVAFDGDGDRAIFLDEKGEAVRGDFIGVIIARGLLAENPGQKILFEVRSSRIVPEIIRESQGRPILGRAGHSFIKEKMRQENVLFGAEMSGHYFFKELGFADNALMAMIKTLEILSRENKPFSEIIAPLKKYFSSNEINFEVKNPNEILKNLEKHFPSGQIKKIDGLTVEFPDWWFNLRKSNTEPLVRLNLEADTQEILEEKLAELKTIINQ